MLAGACTDHMLRLQACFQVLDKLGCSVYKDLAKGPLFITKNSGLVNENIHLWFYSDVRVLNFGQTFVQPFIVCSDVVL